jgi:DnaJ-class molecular chaperone
MATKKTCETCNGTGVVVKNGKQEPCPETECLAGNLARIFRKKERK